jgi:hypothetical protein
VGCESIAMLQCHQLRGCIWDSEANDGDLWHDCPRTSPPRLHEELVVSDAPGMGKREGSKDVASWGPMALFKCVPVHHLGSILCRHLG